MIRRLLVLLIAGFLVAGIVLADDEPAPRLKKKTKPAEAVPTKKEQADQPKKETPKPVQLPKPKDRPKLETEPDEPPPEPEIDEQEVLNRVSKNMRSSEDRLGKKDLSEGTRQVQRDILKDLDDLIKQSQNGGGQQNQDDQQQDQQQNQDQNGAKGQRQQPQQAKGMPGKQGNQKGRQNQRAQREARRSQKRGQQRTAQGKPQQGAGQPQSQQPEAGANPGAGKGGPQGEMNKIADVYKDIWGHLPETLRAEMNAYGREKFMAKYEELIKRYYDRAARESRRKGD